MEMEKIRKQVYELTLADLDEYPVWEFALDEECEEGQDEATVRPYSFNEPLDPSESMFIVKATFNLADGTKMKGFLTPTVPDENDIGYIQPIIVTDSNQVSLWHGIIKPNDGTTSQHYKHLKKSSNEVFPLKYQSDVKLIGGSVSGVIDGFMYMHEERKGLFRKLVTEVQSLK